MSRVLRMLGLVLAVIFGSVVCFGLLVAACVLGMSEREGRCRGNFSSELPPPHFDVEQDLKNASPRLTPSWTPSGSHIVFGAVQYSSDVAGYPVPEGRIYIAESNGSSLLSITEGGGEYVIDHSPSVSPDGSRIAYSTYRYRRDTEPRYFEIETAALDGSGRRRLTEKAGLDIAAAWSPEGDRIAFLRVNACDKAQSLGIYTVESDGSDVRRIMELPDRELGEQHVRALRLRSGLAWSPDGQALAYLIEESVPERDKSTSMRTSLYVVKTKGSDRTRLLVGRKRVWTMQRRGYESDDFISSPAWSPYGRQIAFLKLDDRRYPKLYIIDSDGSNLREVVDPGARSASLPTTSYSGVVSWSSDGSQILFYLSLFDPSSPLGLYSVNADGSALRVLGKGLFGALSPDGSRIAVVLTDASDGVLYTSALDGSNVRVLSRRTDSGLLEPVGTEQRHSEDATSCSRGVVVPDPESNPSLVRDCEALLEMMDQVALAGLNWDANTPITEWKGVVLKAPIIVVDGADSEDPLSPLRVRGLSLRGRGLIGTIPLSVTELTGLWSLNLSDNELTGPIPSELGRLADLRVLDLSENNLSGPIPPELGQLTKLRELTITGYLEGTIPPELGQLTNLRLLTLVGVQSGPIPPELGSLNQLREFMLFGHLDGPIPPELGKLAALESLSLRYSGLSGPIPSELGNLAVLKALDLSSNSLSGPIPTELGNLRAIERLRLEFNNHLTGCIPLALRERLGNEYFEVLNFSLGINYCKQ